MLASRDTRAIPLGGGKKANQNAANGNHMGSLQVALSTRQTYSNSHSITLIAAFYKPHSDYTLPARGNTMPYIRTKMKLQGKE